jgi:ABC-2 type transport system permease protein
MPKREAEMRFEFSFDRVFAVAGRALHQLRADPRFLAFSLIFPGIVIYFLFVLFDVFDNPMFAPTQFIFAYGGFIVHFITFILTAIVVVRERTTGTLPRMFISGYRRVDVVLGYLMAYSLVASVQSLIVLLEINWLFGLDYETGTLLMLYAVMWALAVISMEVGIFISNFARNEGQVFPFIPLILISAIISGIIIPVDRLADWLQVLARFTPLYYANVLVEHIVGGGELLDKLDTVGSLSLYALVVLGLALATLAERD